MSMAQEFGFTREIEDRVQAPCPIWLVAIAKVLSGAAQGALSAAIVLPIAAVVHASGVRAQLDLHWLQILTLVPLSCLAMAGLGLVLGTTFEPPITFLGGTYYEWSRLAPVTIGGWHWLQTIVLINPLIYVNEGMRAAFNDAPHMAPVRHLPGHDRIRRALPRPRPAQLPTSGPDLALPATVSPLMTLTFSGRPGHSPAGRLASATRPGPGPVWVPETLQQLRDLRIFVDQAAEPIAFDHRGCWVRG